jgi:gamma-tubulin complex component 5
MSFSGTIANLTDPLITAITGISPTKSPSKYRKLQETVRAILKDYQAPTTDKSAVKIQLRGLEEKFRVLNNDELADALESRLTELSKHSTTWTPEILSLLVQLSVNPVASSKVEDLDTLKSPPSPPALTWEQILDDDPLENEGGLWDDVDFAAGSSDEDEYSSLDLAPSPKGTLSSTDSDDQSADGVNVTLKEQADILLLHKISKAQFWKADGGHEGELDEKIILTETQAVREALFMLLGLPTVIFQEDHQGDIVTSKRFYIQDVTEDGLGTILMSLASLGQEISILRRWVALPQSIPLVQSFQAALSTKLLLLDASFSEAEDRLINPDGSSAMTLLCLHEMVHKATRPLLPVVPILSTEFSQINTRPFEVLESLYNLACSSESMLDWDAYRFATDLFFPCFQTYLKPIKQWMESGDINEDDKVTFVRRNVAKVPPASLWQDQYVLLTDEAGRIQVPHFLESTAQRIFNIGKTAGFMRSLDLDKSEHDSKLADGCIPQFQALIEREQASGLSPFSEVFGHAVEIWVTGIHQRSSSRLREVMRNRCSLWTTLDALEYVYLSRDGSLTSQVALAISDRIDRSSATWADQYVLTDLFRRLYGQIDCVKPELLRVQPDHSCNTDEPGRRRSMALLDELSCTYQVPWAVANVVKPDSLRIYQRIAILLLQLTRAKHLVAQKLPQYSRLDVNLTKSIYSLRQRQLWFLDNMHSHIATVISSASSQMKAAMKAAEDLDDMITIHEAYITALGKSLFLSENLDSTHQAILALLDMAVIFTDHLKAPNFGSSTTPSPKDRNSDPISEEEEYEILDNPKSTVGYHMSDEVILRMSLNFNKLLGFVIAGLRDASRTGTEPYYAILVETLAIWEKG